MLANVFQLTDDVVSKISDGSRGKWGKSRHRGKLVGAQGLFHYLKNIARTLFGTRVAFHLNLAAGSSDPHVGPRSEKRVTADLLAALNGLQKKGMRLLLGDGQKSGNRSEQ